MYFVTKLVYITCLYVRWTESCGRGQLNCTCVTYFQASSDVLGPNHPRHLGSKVYFKASASWAFNLSLGFKAYVNNKLIMTYPSSIYNMSCGSQMSRSFKFVNQRMDTENPSGHPRVDIVLYADHPDNPDDGNLTCDHFLCRKFKVHYHFPPGPGNIDITLDPPDAVQGQPATITCSTIDGYPKVRFGIRAFSLVYNLELFYTPTEKLTMPAAVAGVYICEAIAFVFRQRMVIPSDKKVTILRKPMLDSIGIRNQESNLNDVTSRKTNLTLHQPTGSVVRPRGVLPSHAVKYKLVSNVNYSKKLNRRSENKMVLKRGNRHKDGSQINAADVKAVKLERGSTLLNRIQLKKRSVQDNPNVGFRWRVSDVMVLLQTLLSQVMSQY
nr:hypothetical protein BgiMline_018081 [Biomphalaria glabrata]